MISKRVQNMSPSQTLELNSKIAKLRQEGQSVIALNSGEPDFNTPPPIIEAAHQAMLSGKTKYTQTPGIPELRDAIARKFKRDNQLIYSADEIIVSTGAKYALTNTFMALCDPGDEVIIPTPCWVSYVEMVKLAGAIPVLVPVHPDNQLDMEAIEQAITTRTKILLLNSPNNPTGAVADLGFFKKAVAFAKKYDILIAHDAPYCDLCFDGYEAPSIMEVEGAKDVAIEFNSLSKTYNMAGWRIGMAVGNQKIIKLLANYKSQIDSSIFMPILDAGQAALTSDQAWLEGRNRIYQDRRDVVYQGLKEAGFEVELPEAALYLWAKLPPKFDDPVKFCADLLKDTGVSMTPGVVYGASGSDYIRISIVIPTDRIAEAIERVKVWIEHR